MLSPDISKELEEGKWTRVHTYSFIAFAIGLFLEGYIFGIASFATGWYSIPAIYRNLLLTWPYLWLIIGIAVGGPLSDKFGRKRTFIYSMALYAIGGVLLASSVNYVLVLTSLALLLFAAGSEMNVIMIMAHEIFPRKDRSKTMMILMDFVALSSAILSAVGFISISSTVSFGRALAGSTILLTIVILIYLRLHMPESIKWLEKTGKKERAINETNKYFSKVNSAVQITEQSVQINKQSSQIKNPPIWFKEVVATLVAFADTTGFGLILIALAPIYFPKLISYIFLIAGVAGFGGGLLGFAGDKLSRKWLLTLSYVGITIIMGITVVTLNIWKNNLILFWILLIAFNAVGQIAYMTEDTLKGELWPTRQRGSLTAIARVVSIGAFIPILFWVSTLPLSEYLAFGILVWAIGAAAAISWHIWGIETGKGVSITTASGESST
jgi:MFS family permease